MRLQTASDILSMLVVHQTNRGRKIHVSAQLFELIGEIAMMSARGSDTMATTNNPSPQFFWQQSTKKIPCSDSDGWSNYLRFCTTCNVGDRVEIHVNYRADPEQTNLQICLIIVPSLNNWVRFDALWRPYTHVCGIAGARPSHVRGACVRNGHTYI